MEERRLDSVCPSCYARLSSSAKFCMECGVEIAPQALVPVPEGASCPRCEGDLRSRDLGQTSVVECTACAGIWCPPDTFRRIIRDADRGASAFRKPVDLPKVNHPFRYLRCLSCKDMMIPRNFGKTSAIMIDVCRDHGVWLDHTELERIVAFIAEEGRPSDDGLGRKPVMEPNPEAIRTLIPGSNKSSNWGLVSLIEYVSDFFLTDLFD